MSAAAGGKLRRGLADAAAGARAWPQWFTLGNVDIRLRFRRTVLGPLWTTVSFGLFAAVLGYVYAQVFGEEVGAYLPFLALGLFAWMFVATTLQEACDAFVHGELVVKQLDLPRSALVYRALWRNVVLMGCNAIVVAAVLLLCRVPLGGSALLVLPGLALLCLNLAWSAAILAVATARYRAVSRVVAAAMPLAMLATPVIWRPDTPRLEALAALNPLSWLIDLVRGPMLGTPPAGAVWLAALAVGLAGCAAALIVFSGARGRLSYWL